jgi:hypothetical protein
MINILNLKRKKKSEDKLKLGYEDIYSGIESIKNKLLNEDKINHDHFVGAIDIVKSPLKESQLAEHSEQDVINPDSISLVENQPPFNLTDLGNELLDFSGAKGFIDEQRINIFNKLEHLQKKSNIEIEKELAELLNSKIDTDQFESINDFIQKNMSFRGIPINLYSILDIMTISLRITFKDQYK